MHAASVHPEPGSNSLKNLYQTPKLLLKRSTRFSELMFFLSFFYFLSNKLLCFNEIPSHVLFVFEISVVQFSMTDAACFRSATFLSYHTFSLLSTPFLNFFQSFFEVFKILSCGKRSARLLFSSELVYYTICLLFCQVVLLDF